MVNILSSSNIRSFFILIISFFFINSVHAQVNQNLANVHVDELTDAQIKQIQAQIRSTGLPDSQLEQAAAARGMSSPEIKKLRSRLNNLQAGVDKNAAAPAGTDVGDTSGVRQANKSTSPDNLDRQNSAIAKSRIFGADLFNNSQITFEPNLRLATPKNYVIGPDDQILIDLNGDNEAHYSQTVSPEGNIRIEYAGIVKVNGLTVEEATARIRAKLIQTYPSLRNRKTTLAVNIGNIRSIRVTVTGEATKPATYTVSSLASVFNVLYLSGGPNPNGSFRQIEIIRNNRLIETLDAYDYLMKGYQTKNIRLQDQDVIRIPVYKLHAELVGEIKHPAIFELQPGETFADLLRFSGGFSDRAYSASVKVQRYTDRDVRVLDVNAANFSSFTPQNGDVFTVDSILNRFQNRVLLLGAVFRPGQFSLDDGLTLSGLIKKADGVKEDAFLSRAIISRLRPDNTTETIPFDVNAIINGTTPDIALKREDVVTISSIFDLRNEYKVAIDGEVRNGGQFDYSEGLSIQDLILKAGGLTEGASPKTIEIARRIKTGDNSTFTTATAQIIPISVDENLRIQDPKFLLKPFDIVTVRNNVGYTEQRRVFVEGEVLHPGPYILSSKVERISDLIKRAGGLTPSAYQSGSSLKRISQIIGTDKNKLDLSEDIIARERNKQRLQATARSDSARKAEGKAPDPVITEITNTTIGIDLVKILQAPGDVEDLILKEGDVLRIPQRSQTVRINGEVLYPVTAVYKRNKGFNYYISQGGGYTEKALNKHAYVIYANGSVQSTHRFLFFKNYPSIRPGAEIFVPKKEDKKPVSITEIAAISTGIASVGAILLGILNLNK